MYKLIGPALIKQDLVEAKSNVGKRIDYIKAEMERMEGQIKGFESKLKDKEQEVCREHACIAWMDGCMQAVRDQCVTHVPYGQHIASATKNMMPIYISYCAWHGTVGCCTVS